MKKLCPETSSIACTWIVQPIYVMKEVGPKNYPTTYNRDEKSLSRKFPYSVYMAFTAYIPYEKIWSRDFPSSLYMTYTVYIRDEEVGPETSPTACT
jgi:hypothetical protein